VTAIRPDSNVIDMTQRRMRQCAVGSPSFIASLVDAIDTEREIAEIEPDPGPSAQWWDKLDWYHRGRQRRDDRRPLILVSTSWPVTYTAGNASSGNASKTGSHKARDRPTRDV
jgi:hypothetical protein